MELNVGYHLLHKVIMHAPYRNKRIGYYETRHVREKLAAWFGFPYDLVWGPDSDVFLKKIIAEEVGRRFINNLETGPAPQKANQGRPERKSPYKPEQPIQPYCGTTRLEREDVHSALDLPEGLLRSSLHTGLQEQASVSRPGPATSSAFVARKLRIREKRRLMLSCQRPTCTTPSSPVRRSPLARWLCLLWLNILLIPTRIAYRLRHSSRGSLISILW